MTPKIIELKQAPVTLIELPEKEAKTMTTTDVRLIKAMSQTTYLGFIPELSEEHFAECVDHGEYITHDMDGMAQGEVFRNYKEKLEMFELSATNLALPKNPFNPSCSPKVCTRS